MRNWGQEQNEVRNFRNFGLVKIIKLCLIVNWEGNDRGWKSNVKHSLAVRKWKRMRTLKATRAYQQRKKFRDHLIKSTRKIDHGSRPKTRERERQRYDLTSCWKRKSYRVKRGWRKRS